MLMLESAFKEFIDSEKIEILEARDGERGVQVANETIPNLIISDIMMPKVNGYEICKMVKEDEKFKGTYFVILTARGQVVDEQKGLSLGADEYITKPFDPDRLIEIVEKVLNIKRTD